MGAWGYKVLANDSALDVMGDLSCSTDIKTDIHRILHEEYQNEDELLLAVSIIDISLNGIDENILGGFYNYEKWFKDIVETPMEELRDDAIQAIRFIQKVESECDPWDKGVAEDRRKLLATIEDRLVHGKSQSISTQSIS